MLSQLSFTRIREETIDWKIDGKIPSSRLSDGAQRKALSREIASIQNICIFGSLYRPAWYCWPMWSWDSRRRHRMVCGHVNESDGWTVAHPNRLNIFQWAIRYMH